MSDEQKEIVKQIAEDFNSLSPDLVQIAAAKISGFAEGVRAAQAVAKKEREEHDN